MSDRRLCLEGVGKSFGAVEVLRDFSLAVERGEFVAIVGPSGCGKTTLLNLFSGFDKPGSGTVVCRGAIRTIHQQGGLFPWQTVAENISIGLRHLKDRQEQRRQLEAMLDLIELRGFADHYPHQLSGGMRRYPAARAGETDTLLMDEPFSSPITCRLRRARSARLLQERPRTVVLVTHDTRRRPRWRTASSS